MTVPLQLTAADRPSPIGALAVDLFCRVIDNWGDLGVCWRLARQLRDEYGAEVRLIVDDIAPFSTIEPRVNRDLSEQRYEDIAIEYWATFESRGARCDCDLVIEVFACDPPAEYVESMAQRSPQPVWINLEYLSAEKWVDGVHGLPSPHRKLPLTKYFFVPGFSPQSGGVIVEKSVRSVDPTERKDAPASAISLTSLNHKERAHSAESSTQRPRVFSFTYAQAPVAALARAFDAATFFLAARLDSHDFEWVQLSPVPQTEFDRLLAAFDLLLVRGEDSFVRAQLAGKPMLWHIYPTDDRAHINKLDAWLDRYCVAMPNELSNTYRRAAHAFVDPESEPDLAHAFHDFIGALPALQQHALSWQRALLASEDLATRLMQFVSEKRLEKDR